MTEREQQDAEARELIRHLPDVAWDVTIWQPPPKHTEFGSIDGADRQRIVREVLAVVRATAAVTEKCSYGKCPHPEHQVVRAAK